jgi:basic membrane lipoprotein Med (substrate-binding protein (PBP1-ABC) superfamily)
MLTFFAETQVKKLKLYFSNPKAGATYTINVQIKEGTKVIYYNSYPSHTFH